MKESAGRVEWLAGYNGVVRAVKCPADRTMVLPEEEAEEEVKGSHLKRLEGESANGVGREGQSGVEQEAPPNKKKLGKRADNEKHLDTEDAWNIEVIRFLHSGPRQFDCGSLRNPVTRHKAPMTYEPNTTAEYEEKETIDHGFVGIKPGTRRPLADGSKHKIIKRGPEGLRVRELERGTTTGTSGPDYGTKSGDKKDKKARRSGSRMVDAYNIFRVPSGQVLTQDGTWRTPTCIQPAN
ncbi:hypothetical protein AAG570_001302 [Ranatra chinensis]|uniref:Uncharacterized protein n=1 Tax=Ranatra chinensis TaxID=642074 RepID=A0ABD0YU16_9HEMI